LHTCPKPTSTLPLILRKCQDTFITGAEHVETKVFQRDGVALLKVIDRLKEAANGLRPPLAAFAGTPNNLLDFNFVVFPA